MAAPRKVSLTTFVDFVSKSGTPKITVVRRFKHGDAYRPAFDFYKPVRDAIVDVHAHERPRKALDDVVASLSDPRKVASFTAVVRGHKRFMRRHAARWFDPPRASWVEGGIVVHVNPELGLEIRGVPHVVKLYFKAERMPKRNVATITRLMAKALAAPGSRTVFGVLDVRRGALHVAERAPPGIDALLTSEAASFAAILGSV
ncbi:MAG TPA: hypothetical protein VFL83_03690 [Anaeromyxobacter sp.]|nr:hypothetical protein [Anaeromyxobacter sp.]